MRYPSPYAPIHYNPAFTPVLRDLAFQAWHEGACRMVANMYEEGAPKDFQHCKAYFALTEQERLH